MPLTDTERAFVDTWNNLNDEVARLRALLADVRDWFDSPDGGGPTSSDLLGRINEALA